MDGARSSPPADGLCLPKRPSSSPTLPILPLTTTTSPEHSGNRQRRLLQGRNARFPAKKLSLSNLGSRISHLIHANEDTQTSTPFLGNQENTSPTRQSNYFTSKSDLSTAALGVLEEISNARRGRRNRQDTDIPLYQDSPERPLLERSPYSSPAVYQDLSSEGVSPLRADHPYPSIDSNMRLREISGNEHRGSPVMGLTLNGSIKGSKKRRSIQTKVGFDTQEYIDHIERELQEAKSEMFSPTTNKSLKDQLRSARHDNDRLKQEMTELREAFESELKRALENKTNLEVECKRKVRDLEEELEQKMLLVRDLEMQHDEKRLDNSTIDTLKATIERLEQDKMVLEDENRSVSKRNEVLSELLAMSPTKAQQFELRSPIREKRPGRPMSMIIPRPMLSPSRRQSSQPSSAIASPSLSSNAPFFAQLDSTTPAMTLDSLTENLEKRRGELSQLDTSLGEGPSVHSASAGLRSRTSTLQSQSSSNPSLWGQTRDSSPHDDLAQRLVPKRKPRRFMAGSTQLKPLLLPALTGETVSQPSSSVVSSPRMTTARSFSHESIDPTTYFLSPLEDSSFTDSEPVQGTSRNSSKDTIVAYQTFEQILAEHEDVTMPGNHSQASESESVPRDGICPQTSQPVEYGSYTCSAPHRSGLLTPELRISEKHASSVDLECLSQLRLPEPQYDDLRFTQSRDGARNSTDIPQPLFSTPAASHKLIGPVHHGTASLDNDEARRRLRSEYADKFHPSEVAYLWREVKTHRFSSANPRHDQALVLSPASQSVSSDRSELPQRSTLKPRPKPNNSLVRTRSLLDILQHEKLGARPLASLTIRTLFRTISQCAAYMKVLKRDPLTLARRVIANAWFSNWSRLGRLSWWVLGLLITPSLGGPKLKKWSWDQYDGEAIAQKFCRNEEDSADCKSTPQSTLPDPSRFEPQDINDSSETSDGNRVKKKPGWGRSIILWGKFSFAIMLAVGGAVVKGPGEMLKDMEVRESQTHQEAQMRTHTTRQRFNYLPSSRRPISATRPQSTRRPLRGRHSYSSSSPSRKEVHNESNIRSRLPKARPFSSPLSEDALRELQLVYSENGDEDTLRPPRSPRTHVADLFYDGPLNNEGGSPDYAKPLGHGWHRSSRSQTSSIGDGILQWPPSPGPIHPTEASPRTHDWTTPNRSKRH